MRRPVLPLILVLLLCSVLSGVRSEPVGMAYLKIGAGADAVGMGDAVVSHVDGPTATYWNPGALGFLPGLQVGMVHNESFLSVRQEFAGLVRNLGRWSVGASFNGTWTDNLTAYSDSGDSIGYFGYYGYAAALSGGYRLNDTWGVGGSVKLIQEAIDVWSVSGVAFDLGLQARELLPRLDAGVSMLHLGPSLKYVQESFALPLTVQGGLTYHLGLPALGAEALLVAELRKIRKEDASLHIGIEYRLQQAVQLRAGYRTGLDTEDVSLGLGFRRGRLQADYAYVPFGEELGNQHRIGLTYRR